MKPLILTLALLWAAQAVATPNPLYFSFAGSGSQSGADPADTQTLGWVNTGGNVPAGTTLILIGTCPSGVGITANNCALDLTNGSGFNPSNSLSVYIYPGISGTTIDGTGGGFVSCTANGSQLANQTAVWAVQCGDSVANLTIKNLIFTNIYVHSLLSDTNQLSDITGGIYDPSCLGNNLFQNLTMINVGNGIECLGAGYYHLSNCNFQLYNHGFYSGSVNGGSCLCEHCFFGVTSNWDDTADTYHHDKIIWFGAGVMNSMLVYTNTFDGDDGIHGNCEFFNDGGRASAAAITRGNLFKVHVGNHLANGCFTGGGQIVNNTWIDNNGNNIAISVGGAGAYVENNLGNGFLSYLIITGPLSSSAIGWNIWGNPPNPNSQLWIVNGTPYIGAQYAAYAAAANEVDGQYLAISTNLVNTITGALLPGSAAIGAGNSSWATYVGAFPFASSGGNPWLNFSAIFTTP